ncbi:amidophosphoribosyltransferase [Melissococcus plutonius]|uniref:amidophosphoribosyltransferase n=1 Tax=Melissococcus plutonius TaxID=33970 RepID=UPI00065DD46B|nr:amidophosphoribosyltransferase [Melissococcus plutonius]KMT31048.1 amidophosphoribosyltransferase PurF [Melissococcus plutonius]KMT33721.1 amidophosphoribosyltransferase PurF [Melissococcus plutonius]BBD15549.1 amidophosphoribosyltransferase [Melissococcus plutonius]
MSAEVRSLNEECGIFGIWGHEQASQIVYFGLHCLQHRGQEGAGIISNDQGKLLGHRDLGLLADVFKEEDALKKLTGTSAIGHVRYATAGNRTIENIQPFLFNFCDGSFGLAHNGNLTNATTLKKQLERSGTIFQSTSDTEILMHLIRKNKQPTFIERLKASLNQVKGGFAYLMITEKNMIAALDANAFRPLVVGQMKNGAYIISSETCALEGVRATFVRDVQPGEIIIIDDNGCYSDFFTKNTKHSICSMEFIYFARPDSTIAGVNVHTARKNTGRRLAIEAPVEADMVIGVPNSSLSAASGYAETSGIPYELGLVKNQYIARTFIQPTQKLREQGVKMKLSAVCSVVSEKRVIIVDDSIVRGTTSRRIVRLLKEAGAKEVHVRIASPPIKYLCFYGIDIQTKEELIASNHSVEEIRQLINADSLAFLSETGLIQAIDLPYKNEPYNGLCMAYFNGDYPTPLYDYENEFLTALSISL